MLADCGIVWRSEVVSEGFGERGAITRGVGFFACGEMFEEASGDWLTFCGELTSSGFGATDHVGWMDFFRFEVNGVFGEV